jgi:lipoprotein NlpD
MASLIISGGTFAMLVKRVLNWLRAVFVAAVLTGCASDGGHAPVSEHGATEKKPAVSTADTVTIVAPAKKSVQPEKDWRPQTYVVQKGDTLYSIAFNHGLGYHEIADINNIQNPDVIQVGQEIRLFPAGAVAVKSVAAESKPQETLVKDQPKVAMLPYSERAMADIQKMQETPHKTEPVAVAKAEPKPEASPESKPEAVADSAVADDALEWGMPTTGKVIGEFSESANRKGVDISGKLGQAVVASAAGKVVYSGSGLRGYGKLVIIKHNNTYLSAYAHNDQVLVKEGQAVTKGQKIAEMGSTDSDQVKLHFEIRKFGKPVDPAKYLPLVKS